MVNHQLLNVATTQTNLTRSSDSPRCDSPLGGSEPKHDGGTKQESGEEKTKHRGKERFSAQTEALRTRTHQLSILSQKEAF